MFMEPSARERECKEDEDGCWRGRSGLDGEEAIITFDDAM